MPDTYEETNGKSTGQSAATWRTSSYSHPYGNCVEVASLPDGVVGVRDSVTPTGGVLRFTSAEWATFVAGVRGDDVGR